MVSVTTIGALVVVVDVVVDDVVVDSESAILSPEGASVLVEVSC